MGGSLRVLKIQKKPPCLVRGLLFWELFCILISLLSISYRLSFKT